MISMPSGNSEGYKISYFSSIAVFIISPIWYQLDIYKIFGISFKEKNIAFDHYFDYIYTKRQGERNK